MQKPLHHVGIASLGMMREPPSRAAAPMPVLPGCLTLRRTYLCNMYRNRTCYHDNGISSTQRRTGRGNRTHFLCYPKAADTHFPRPVYPVHGCHFPDWSTAVLTWHYQHPCSIVEVHLFVLYLQLTNYESCFCANAMAVCTHKIALLDFFKNRRP